MLDENTSNLLPSHIILGSSTGTSVPRRPSSGRRSSSQSAERRSTGVLGLVALEDPNGTPNFVLAAVPSPTPKSPTGPPKVTGVEITVGQRESELSPNAKPAVPRPASGRTVKRRSVSSGDINFIPEILNPKPVTNTTTRDISSEPSIIQNFEKFFKNSTLSQAYAALPDTLSSNIEASTRPRSGYKSGAVPLAKQHLTTRYFLFFFLDIYYIF